MGGRERSSGTVLSQRLNMSAIPNTLATLTVHYVRRTGPIRFIFGPIKAICICHRIESIIPNLHAPVEMAFTWHPFLGLIGKCEFSQWKKQNTGSREFVFDDIQLTDTELRSIWIKTLGGTIGDGVFLTPAKAIARLIGVKPWKKATYKSLGLI